MEVWCLNTAHSRFISNQVYSGVLCVSLVSQCKIDSVLNDDLRIVTGCLRPPNDLTAHPWRIQPSKPKPRLGVTLLFTNRNILDPEHLLHYPLVKQLDARKKRLKSRRPCVHDAHVETIR